MGVGVLAQELIIVQKRRSERSLVLGLEIFQIPKHHRRRSAGGFRNLPRSRCVIAIGIKIAEGAGHRCLLGTDQGLDWVAGIWVRTEWVYVIHSLVSHRA